MNYQAKYPELSQTFTALQEEKAALVAQTASLHAERDAVREQIQPLDAKERELTKQIRSIEMPRMAELDMQIAALARGMGARTTADVPTDPPADS